MRRRLPGGLNHLNLAGGEVQYGLPRDDQLGGESVTKRVLVDSVVPPRVEISEFLGGAAIALITHGMEVSSQSRQADGTFKNDVSVKLSTRASLALAVQQDNSLDISFPTAPRYEISAFKLGNGNWQSDANNTLANDLIESTIGMILNQIATPFANIPIPAFLCAQFTVNNISAIGGQNSHLNFAGSVGVSPDCPLNNQTEQTAYGRGTGVKPACPEGSEESDGQCYPQCEAGYVGEGGSCYQAEDSALMAIASRPELLRDGFGARPTRCNPGDETQGDVCYPRCEAGFSGLGSSCVSNLPASYPRAATVPSNVFNGVCESRFERVDGLCYVPCRKGYVADGAQCKLERPSYERGLGYQPSGCLPNQVLEKGRCVAACRAGTLASFDRCIPVRGNAVSRGVGTPPSRCAEGYKCSAGQCYPQCRPGFVADGALCKARL